MSELEDIVARALARFHGMLWEHASEEDQHWRSEEAARVLAAAFAPANRSSLEAALVEAGVIEQPTVERYSREYIAALVPEDDDRLCWFPVDPKYLPDVAFEPLYRFPPTEEHQR